MTCIRNHKLNKMVKIQCTRLGSQSLPQVLFIFHRVTGNQERSFKNIFPLFLPVILLSYAHGTPILSPNVKFGPLFVMIYIGRFYHGQAYVSFERDSKSDVDVLVFSLLNSREIATTWNPHSSMFCQRCVPSRLRGNQDI